MPDAHGGLLDECFHGIIIFEQLGQGELCQNQIVHQEATHRSGSIQQFRHHTGQKFIFGCDFAHLAHFVGIAGGKWIRCRGLKGGHGMQGGHSAHRSN